MAILSSEVTAYLRDLQPSTDGVLREIEEAAEGEMPTLPWATARFIAGLVRAIDPPRILEIGTGFGYTTLQMAEAGTGQVTTVENHPGRAAKAREFLAGKAEVLEGEFRQLRLDGPFDLVLIDVNRVDSLTFLNLVPFAPRAVVLVPATLIWGLVAKESDSIWRSEVETILVATQQMINAKLLDSEQWSGVVLPVGGGLTFAVRAPRADNRM